MHHFDIFPDMKEFVDEFAKKDAEIEAQREKERIESGEILEDGTHDPSEFDPYGKGKTALKREKLHKEKDGIFF